MITITIEAPKLRVKKSAGGLAFNAEALVQNLQAASPAIQKAIMNGIEKASFETRDYARAELSAKLECDNQLIYERVTSDKVTLNRPLGHVRISAKRIALKHFSPMQTKRGVQVRVAGRTKRYRSGFGPNIRRLGGNVFVRKTKRALPIRKIPGVSVAAIAKRTGLDDKLADMFRAQARRHIKRNLLIVAFNIREAA